MLQYFSFDIFLYLFSLFYFFRFIGLIKILLIIKSSFGHNFSLLLILQLLHNPSANKINPNLSFGFIVSSNQINIWLITKWILVNGNANLSLNLFKHINLVRRQKGNSLTFITITCSPPNAMNIIRHSTWHIIIYD